MKTNTKKLLTLACMFTLGGTVAIGGASLGLFNANATGGSFAINEGAAVRTDAPAGIRFETTIGGAEYEELKAKNQMSWVQEMNSIRHQAEEIIITEIVFN